MDSISSVHAEIPTPEQKSLTATHYEPLLCTKKLKREFLFSRKRLLVLSVEAVNWSIRKRILQWLFEHKLGSLDHPEQSFESLTDLQEKKLNSNYRSDYARAEGRLE